MRKLIALLLASVALAACDGPPHPTQSSAPVPAGCWKLSGNGGRVICPDQQTAAVPQERKVYAQMYKGSSDTYYVEVSLLGVPLKMLLDTGSTDVSIPIGLWAILHKRGILTDDRYVGVANFRMADGRVSQGLRYRLPPLTINGHTVYDVIASTTRGDNSRTILLGQSFLQKFRSWQIDNATGQLVLAY